MAGQMTTAVMALCACLFLRTKVVVLICLAAMLLILWCILLSTKQTFYSNYKSEKISSSKDDVHLVFPAEEDRLNYAVIKTKAPRSLIIESECIANLNVNKMCNFPLEIATESSASPPMAPFPLAFARVSWSFEERADQDFWLFRATNNASNLMAIKKLQTKQILMAFGTVNYTLELPAELETFQRRWHHGRFIPCQIVLHRNESTKEKRFMPLSMVDRGAELVEHMERHNMTAMLFGGTLLGWRRECSLIPHTGDLDFAIFSQEHSTAFLESLIHSEKFLLKWILGHPSTGLELTLWMDNFKTDIFYIYYNKTRGQHYTTGMRVDARQRLYWYYPRIESQLCAVQMHAHIFHVPCNVDSILAAEYGPQAWKVDIPTSEFAYDRSHKNKESGELFSDTEWTKLYNLYYPKVEHNQTLPNWE